jgi:hypothetical protein
LLSEHIGDLATGHPAFIDANGLNIAAMLRMGPGKRRDEYPAVLVVSEQHSWLGSTASAVQRIS